jgi:hypothetical protein
MTPDGYREFEVRPAVDVRLALSPDSDQSGQDYTYEIVGMTENEMIIQMKWNNPEAISQSGVSSDAITVTFWDNELL